MTDAEALHQLVFQKTAARGRALSKLGYFCTPFRPENGPFHDKVIKVYQAQRNHETLKSLVHAHDDYVQVLRKLGVTVPKTAIHLLPHGPKLVPVIVQDAIETKFMMRSQMIEADLTRALALMDNAGEVIARFWNGLTKEDGRVGFHPSIRNFAVINDRAVFFDSFPPLIHYTHAEMGKVLLLFSESRLIRFIGPLVPQKLAAIQDEWYSASETLIGLVGSACRLRPEDREAFLDWGRLFAQSAMPKFADDILRGLERPPRLPRYWTGFRKLLGLQGEPNL